MPGPAGCGVSPQRVVAFRLNCRIFHHRRGCADKPSHPAILRINWIGLRINAGMAAARLSKGGADVTRAELLCRHFAVVYERLLGCGADTLDAASEAARQAADGAVPDGQRSLAVSALAALLFPDGEDDPQSKPAQTFGERVGDLMRARGMRQWELAAALGITQHAVSMMLSRLNQPQKGTVRRVAKALGLSRKELWP